MVSLIISNGHVMEHVGDGGVGVPHANTPLLIAKAKLKDGRWVVSQRVPPKDIRHATISAKVQVLLCEASNQDPDGCVVVLRDPLVVHEIIGDGDVLFEVVRKATTLIDESYLVGSVTPGVHALISNIRKKIIAHDKKKARTAKAEEAHDAHMVELGGLIERLREYGYDGIASCRGVIIDEKMVENIVADLGLLAEAKGMLEGIQKHIHGRHHASVQVVSFGALERDTDIKTCDQHPCSAIRAFLKNF